MNDCLIRANANVGGRFATSRAADALIASARAAMADFVNASRPEEIVFGQNMTSLTFQVARSLARKFAPGDEIVLTRMEHDANVSPWLLMARDRGLTVKWLDFNPSTYEFEPGALADLLTGRTRFVALNHASNILGTVNDVAAMTALAKEAGALVYIDSVQYAPHLPIDVQAIGCDFLVCSSYKFFGPHQGILWGRESVLNELDAYKVRPALDIAPDKYETGTQSHEGLAGVAATVDYFAALGASLRGDLAGAGRRENLLAAMDALFTYEVELTEQLIDGLLQLPGVKVHGITAREGMHRRVPTVSFTSPRRAPAEIVQHLAQHNIFAWDGHNYALEPASRLGLIDGGGVVRLGLAHYNTRAEVDQVLGALAEVLV